MTTLTITAKGQVTLKKDLLDHLGLRPGDKIEVAKQPNGGLSIAPIIVPRRTRMEDAFGMLHVPGRRPLTVEEMNEAIAESRVADDARIMREVRRRSK